MRNQINLTLGTAGHIDHGKTALIKCLTGCDTDRLKEEKERGMSIELGYAPCTLGSLEVGIVDVPGHENFIRTMVAGASGIDACMLVVAADDGPMPQTREHLDILSLLDVRHGVVVLTKIDRVSAEELQTMREVLVDYLRGTFLENAPIVPVSNVTGQGLGELYEKLSDLVAHIKPRPVDGVFRMPVERAFSIKGHGTVVAGVPMTGSARVEDEIVLLPDGVTTRIKSIQVYGQESTTVLAGQCTAINVRHWDHRSIARGKTVTVPGLWEPHAWCVVQLRLLPQDRLFLKHGATVRFHTGTTERLARAYLLAEGGMRGGETGFVQLRFEEPIIAGPRDRFIIRDLSPARTIGGGVILKTLPQRLNRNEPGVRDRLGEHLAALGDDRSFAAFLANSAKEWLIDAAALARRAKLPVQRMRAILDEMASAGVLVRTPEGTYLRAETARQLGEELLARLEAYHRESPASPGLLLDDLRQTWMRKSETADTGTPVPGAAIQAVVEQLRSAGRIRIDDQRLALAGHSITIPSADADPLGRLEAMFVSRPFNPPDPTEAAAALAIDGAAVQRLVRILLEHRKLVRIDRDLLVHRDALQRAREMIISHIRQKGRLESVDFKYMLDTTRKYAIPLLDYFDRTGLTRRASDNTRHLRNPEVT